MRFKNPFKKEVPIQRPAPPKKNNCKISFKKTATGEVLEFSPECSQKQVDMAKQMREEKRLNEEGRVQSGY